MKHGDDQKMVRVVIGALTDKTMIVGSGNKTSSNISAIGYHASMFGYLAIVFKESMIDPLDKTKKKTFERIFKFFQDVFFSEGHEEVANGCAISIIDIFENVFPKVLVPEK